MWPELGVVEQVKSVDISFSVLCAVHCHSHCSQAIDGHGRPLCTWPLHSVMAGLGRGAFEASG